MFFLDIRICSICVSDAQGGRKRASDPLELDIIGGCEPTYKGWEPNMGALQEQQGIKTVEPTPMGICL